MALSILPRAANKGIGENQRKPARVNAGRIGDPRGVAQANDSKVGVPGFQHGRETGGFHFAPPPCAWFFKMAVTANFLQSSFAINFLFEAPQRLVHRFALFQFNLSQSSSLPFHADGGPLWPAARDENLIIASVDSAVNGQKQKRGASHAAVTAGREWKGRLARRLAEATAPGPVKNPSLWGGRNALYKMVAGWVGGIFGCTFGTAGPLACLKCTLERSIKVPKHISARGKTTL